MQWTPGIAISRTLWRPPPATPIVIRAPLARAIHATIHPLVEL